MTVSPHSLLHYTVVPPTIDVEPVSLIDHLQNTAAVFSIMASSGVAITYQWQFNGGDISLTDTGYSGVDSDSLTVQANALIDSAHAGMYRCIATNSEGFTESAEAELSLCESHGHVHDIDTI